MGQPTFDLVVTCMGRLQHLRRSMPTFLAQSDTQVILVDWSCPEACGAWAAAQHPQVQVVQVPGQTRFNAAAARNAGVAAGSAPWLLLVDADVLLGPCVCRDLVAVLQPGHRYQTGSQDPGLIGTTVVARADFERIDGYDDIIEGWGGEDRDLYQRLADQGVVTARFPNRQLSVIDHDDQLRTQHHAQTDKRLQALVNQLYCSARRDLEALSHQRMARSKREALYQQAHAALDHARRNGSAVVEFSIEHRTMFSLRQTTVLRYQLERSTGH